MILHYFLGFIAGITIGAIGLFLALLITLAVFLIGATIIYGLINLAIWMLANICYYWDKIKRTFK